MPGLHDQLDPSPFPGDDHASHLPVGEPFDARSWMAHPQMMPGHMYYNTSIRSYASSIMGNVIPKDDPNYQNRSHVYVNCEIISGQVTHGDVTEEVAREVMLSFAKSARSNQHTYADGAPEDQPTNGHSPDDAIDPASEAERRRERILRAAEDRAKLNQPKHVTANTDDEFEIETGAPKAKMGSNS